MPKHSRSKKLSLYHYDFANRVTRQVLTEGREEKWRRRALLDQAGLTIGSWPKRPLFSALRNGAPKLYPSSEWLAPIKAMPYLEGISPSPMEKDEARIHTVAVAKLKSSLEPLVQSRHRYIQQEKLLSDDILFPSTQHELTLQLCLQMLYAIMDDMGRIKKATYNMPLSYRFDWQDILLSAKVCNVPSSVVQAAHARLATMYRQEHLSESKASSPTLKSETSSTVQSTDEADPKIR